jgi:hypothetical protein
VVPVTDLIGRLTLMMRLTRSERLQMLKLLAEQEPAIFDRIIAEVTR